jgi:hypothetical protein
MMPKYKTVEINRESILKSRLDAAMMKTPQSLERSIKREDQIASLIVKVNRVKNSISKLRRTQ